MTTTDKFFIGVFAFVALGLGAIGGRLTAPHPSPTLGGATLYAPRYQATQVTTNATTTVAAYPGVLHTITFNKPLPGTVVTVYDSATSTQATVSSSVVIAVITVPIAPTSTPFTLTYDGNFANGLTVSMSGASSTMTFNYQQQ